MAKEKISLIMPTRERPDNMERIWESAKNTATESNLLEICFYIDDDDNSSIEKAKSMSKDKRVKYILGRRICLSECWNVAYNKLATGTIIMHCGDDIIFRTKNWDNLVRSEFDKYDDKIVLVFGRDGIHHGNPPKLATHSFIHTNWINQTGYFVPPYFVSDYNDTWLSEVAQKIGRYVYLNDVYTEHMHFCARKSTKDKNTIDRLERHHKERPDIIYGNKKNERNEDARKLQKFINNLKK